MSTLLGFWTVSDASLPVDLIIAGYVLLLILLLVFARMVMHQEWNSSSTNFVLVTTALVLAIGMCLNTSKPIIWVRLLFLTFLVVGLAGLMNFLSKHRKSLGPDF